jgi:hypothetical protein
MESKQLATLNLRTNTQGNKVIEQVDLANTLQVFLERLSEELKMEKITIKKGFPPKPVFDMDRTLQELGIKSKDTLIVEGLPAQPKVQLEPQKVSELVESLPKQDDFKITSSDGAFMYRRIIEANDSCLFNSLGFALKGTLSSANEQRYHVAAMVMSDPQ